ncbi:MAG: sulfatase [Verrucomicrobiales bacterium]|nr:sulfatase [Verrucomicrobiales bacterium]
MLKPFLTLLLTTSFSFLIAEERPNVLFLICDDLNCDLSSYGHPLVKTPNLDRLAEEGVQFDNAHCQFALCGPSRASFMTGLYPDQTLIQTNSVYLRQTLPNVISLPQHFRDAGYFATRIGKLYHYGVPRHMGNGGHDDPYSWDHTINPIGIDKLDEDQIFTLKPGTFGATLSWWAAPGSDHDQTDGMIADEAIERLKWHAKREDSFFLAVGFFRPHTPYVAPKNYFDLYPLDEIILPEIPENYLDSIPPTARRTIVVRPEEKNMTDEQRKQVLQAYYASISFADAQLGRVLDSLKEEGLDENTIVLFTSDHGYHMGEHGKFQKLSLFENATRVPFIIRAPGQDLVGHRTNTPAEMTDFYPTLAELAGLPVPDHCSGVSLVPALNEATASPRVDALSQLTLRTEGYSLKTERYRLTEWKGKDGVIERELYDHKADGAEMNNLAGKATFAELESSLSARLQERIAAAKVVPEGLQQVTDFEEHRVPNFDFQRKKKLWKLE